MNKEELLQTIEQAARDGVSSLDLSGRDLVSLPPEIGQLTSLRRLSLSNNQLTALPPQIGQLSSLKWLDLGDNRLTTLPWEIGQLANLVSLVLHNNQITALPPKIGQLTNLRRLSLSNNRLMALPREIGQLTSLTRLSLSNNQLVAPPSEIGQLTNLLRISLNNNQITTLPSEIGQLTNLTRLSCNNNQVTTLPPEIGQLTSLTRLSLSNNQLVALPPEIGQFTNLTGLFLSNNQLTALPPEIAQLASLQQMYLDYNQLTALPPEIAQLASLEDLRLRNNQLTMLPQEITQLTKLTRLSLSDNQLKALPSEIAQLTNLIRLSLHSNQLTALPPEIAQLADLKRLFLYNNQLTALPSEIGQLSSLELMDLDYNQITTLPLEIGQLTGLESLSLDGNAQLISPPPEIVEQGTPAVLAYLSERLKSSSRQWVSKLLVVGQGGVGKTSMLRALRGEGFNRGEDPTHGIEIRSLELDHPEEAGVTMQLNAWDFGGQEIQHATHQFFLTNRSLFLLVWNVRHGFEQGKLRYWLDTIQALAPDSPVLLVATHIDRWDADIPLGELRREYPQIIGQCEISNATGYGIDALRSMITTAATGLPLMGEVWPTIWLDAANAVRSRPEKHITPHQLWDLMAEYGVNGDSAVVLASWLHELGEILYFHDNDELNDIVILEPQWVSQYISEVLRSEEVIEKSGIFTREHMDALWRDLDPTMRNHFLNLMERFDLSYRTLENREISLVVERLPLDQPDYEPMWDAPKANGDYNEIAMKFDLNTIPAGIPTWFIARSHRFTTRTHWRNGALFAYEPERKHLALVRSLPHQAYLELIVRGPNPHNFFALLKDGIEVTLARFPGLRITRLIPCPGHHGESCSHEFDYEQLLKRVGKKPTIECTESLEDVSVTGLLFGLHWTTQDAVMLRLDDLKAASAEHHEEVLSEIRNLRELAQREFTNAFRREQAKIESWCPNVFALRPRDVEGWRKFLRGMHKSFVGQRIDLQLYCQAPGRWHPTVEGGLYQIDEPSRRSGSGQRRPTCCDWAR